MSTVIAIENLGVRLREADSLLLDQVSFKIGSGEIFSLVGESGSGKSLTALSIMRLLPEALEVCAGRVQMGTTALFELPEVEMNAVRGKKMAMIFQEPQTSLNPVQTVGQQVAEVFALHQGLSYSRSRDKVIALLQEVGIPQPEKRLDWYPHQLSGGQKQRVMIAIALACEPDLLIADEPTTALDVTIQKQILDLLKTLCKQRGLAMLLITHDMGVVYEMADRVAVMRYGKIIETNQKSTFFTSPEHPYSKQLIDAIRDSMPDGDTGKEALLQVKGLKVWFPIQKGLLRKTVDYTRAVNEVSFEIHKGETLALVGESGCGKTTIGKALLRLTPIYAGEINFQANDRLQRIDLLNAVGFLGFRKDIQIIFQDPFSSMNPRFTVRTIIEEGMMHLLPELTMLERRLRVEALIERVGLEQEHLDRFPHEFSGGQRQRIAIARALAVKPKLIVCDEPTSALDVSIREQILTLLKQLQQEEGLSYLFITHDLSLVPRVAHRVAVMKDGVIVEQGTVHEVMEKPQQEYTQHLLAAAPVLHVV